MLVPILKNKAFPLIFIFCIIICSTLHAQKSTPEIDYLIKVIDETYSKKNIDKKKLLELTSDLYYSSKEAKFTKGQTYAIFEEAKVYYFEGDFALSLKRIKEGVDLAKSQKDYDMLCRLLLIYQSSLLRLNYVNKAQQNLIKCEEYNELNTSKENKKINDIFIDLAQADLMVDGEGLSHDLKPVITLKKKAYSTALELNDSNKYKKITVIYSLESLAWTVALSANTNEARQYTQELDKLLAAYPNNYSIIQNFIIKGAIENIDQNYNEAISYFSQAIALSKKYKSIYNLYEVYPMISASYGQIDEYKKAMKYSWEFKHLSDSIEHIKKKTDNIDLINKINTKISEKEEPENRLNKTVLAAIAVVLLLAAASFLWYKKFKKNTENDNGVLLNSTNEAIVPEDNPEAIKGLVNLAREDINSFYIEFRKVYPNFYQTLQEYYPELNVSDLNFCTLIKMNFEIKEISIYSNASIRSVESRRYRIIKKMNLRNQDDLYITISLIN